MVGFDAHVKGEDVVDMGFTDFILVDPISLLTRGFLSECSAIWAQANEVVSTSWGNANPSLTTSWANANPSITTTWSSIGDC